LEQVQRSRERVRITRSALFDDKGQPVGSVYRSLYLNFIRIIEGAGTPLEVLDSTRRLSDVLEAYGNALTDYDRARFRLLIALGMPPEAILDPRLMPQPRCEGPALPPPLTAPQPIEEVPPPLARGTAPTYSSAAPVPPAPAPVQGSGGRLPSDGWEASPIPPGAPTPAKLP